MKECPCRCPRLWPMFQKGKFLHTSSLLSLKFGLWFYSSADRPCYFIFASSDKDFSLCGSSEQKACQKSLQNILYCKTEFASFPPQKICPPFPLFCLAVAVWSQILYIFHNNLQFKAAEAFRLYCTVVATFRRPNLLYCIEWK